MIKVEDILLDDDPKGTTYDLVVNADFRIYRTGKASEEWEEGHFPEIWEEDLLQGDFNIRIGNKYCSTLKQAVKDLNACIQKLETKDVFTMRRSK